MMAAQLEMGAQLDSHPVFDPEILHGFHLLESDAGTGKTWTIAGLVVRALVERELEIDRILVVTFTNAATAELAARIRERIAAMAELLEDAIAGRASAIGELFCSEYLPRIAEPRQALARLRIALSRIDEASVRTIHGFCQRVIDEYGLTIGLPDGIEVGEGDAGWIDSMLADWWRRNVVRGDARLLALLADSGATPQRLAELLRAIHANPGARRESPGCDWRELAVEVGELRRRMSAALADESAALLEWIGVKGNVNGHKVSRAHSPGRLARLADWCAAGAVGGGYSGGARQKLIDAAGFLTEERFREGVGAGPMPPTSIPALCSDFLRLMRRCDAVAAQLAETIWSDTEAQRLGRRSSGSRLGFDELLAIVHDALVDPATGAQLARALRERYPLALIDECQDTDALQWEIFRRIHLPDGSLVLVGDPKQAIYAFRGADVYSYLEARLAGPRQHALRENQRSVPGLVEAVNALFGSDRPFGVSGIDFAAAQVGRRTRRALGGAAHDQRAPLTVLRFAGDPSGKPLTIEQATQPAVAATVAEIDRLLRAGLRLDEKPVQPADFAVLVDSHRQGSLIKRALAEIGIGAVEVSRDSVVDSAEAGDLARWLAAAADPADAGLIRSALVATPGGLDAVALEALAADPAGWNAWVDRFAACRDTWSRLGAQAALRRLLFDSGAACGLARLRDGERRLTNLLHLFELVEASDEAAQGPRQALRWLARARATRDAVARDAVELRLDSDENLVRILTIHKSKGLEFPFVFLPFAWHGRKPKVEPPLVHHVGPDSRSARAGHWQAVLELRDSPVDTVIEQAVFETQAEAVRRLYVALTRAEQRCHVLWGPVASIDETPLARVLAALAKPVPVPDDDGSGEGAGAASAGACAAAAAGDPAALAALVATWRDRAPAGSIAILDVDALVRPGPSAIGPGQPAPAAPRAREFATVIPPPWIRTSFSALSARLAGQASAFDEADERPDHDGVDSPPPAGDDFGVAEPRDIRFGFPAGARAGSCLHGILEHCEFGASIGAVLVRQQLARAGFHDIEAAPVARWLDAVLDTHLTAPDGRTVALRALRAGACAREMDFHLPGVAVDDRALVDAVASEYPLDALPARSRWDGFLRGFIDLVFEHDGRWYVLDWKSNRLGDRFESYLSPAIEASMREHAYSLQACLYLLVLHRFLRLRLPDYDWDRDVGGAFWVFLRGVRAQAGAGPTPGVHASKPSRALIERLDRLFAGDGAAHGGRS